MPVSEIAVGENLTNDYYQVHIYNEYKEENNMIETYRHVLGVIGSLFSIVGVIGNLMSLIILLRPTTSTHKHVLKRKFKNKQNLSSVNLNHKLQSFYSYLIALSLCDLFSCVFAIVNVLEYIHPPYIDHNSKDYRQMCLYLSVYTHPIALTLQTLSIWIICAFSMHRCRSIIRPSFLDINKRNKNSFLKSCLKKLCRNVCCCTEKIDLNDSDHRVYLCQLKLKNNCSSQRMLLEFYTRSISYLFSFYPNKLLRCSYCFCVYSPEYETDQFNGEDTPTLTSLEYEFKTLKEKPKQNKPMGRSERSSKLTQTRVTLICLYMAAALFLIPQLFEKKIVKIDVEDKIYLFPEITEFGRSKVFRQVFHLWFYLIAVYTVPFLLIFIFNFMLLRGFLTSRKKCLPYKMRKDPTHVLRDMSVVDPSTMLTTEDLSRISSKSQKSTSTRKTDTVITSQITSEDGVPPSHLNFQQRQENFKYSLKINSVKICKRSRTLTLTLFGVVVLFGICHLPSIISRIFYVAFPELEFKYRNNIFFGLFTDISNLLVMINSSLNFILYIVFGPGKFRQEFGIILYSLCGCLTDFFNRIVKALSVKSKRRNSTFEIQSELENYPNSNNNSNAPRIVSDIDYSDRTQFSLIKDDIEEEDN